jgi:hypothetical protein
LSGRPRATRSKKAGFAAAAREAHEPEVYRELFAITLLKTIAVAVAISVFYPTGLYK